MAGDNVASCTPTAASARPRPQLKGLHANFMKKHLAIGVISSFVAVALAKVLINDPRKKAYAEYYK